MRITFIQHACANLGIEYLSSSLKKGGHKVSLVIDPQLFDDLHLGNKLLGKVFDVRETLAQEVEKTKPDLVGFSVFTSDYQWALDIARRIKEKNEKIPIIFGGIHPTVVPEVVIKEKDVDIVCVGEGEQALLELARSFDKKRRNYKIKNLWFKKKNGEVVKNELRPLLENLDELPLPDKDLFLSQSPSFLKKYYLIMATRGCPYRCTYCANHVKAKIYRGKGRYLRIRSVESVMKELIWAKKRYPLKLICIPDDILPLNKQWMREFIERYKKEIDLPFMAYAHPRYIDEEMAQLLQEGGCFWLNMGLQTASEKIRMELLKRVETNDEVRRAVKCCHKAGLKFSLDHIFNIPFEGEKEYIEGLKFYNELRPTWINVFWLVYFPKTEIIELGKKAGYIDEKTEREINEGKTPNCCVLKIGKGEKDISRSSTREFKNFALLYTLLPFIPQKVMERIIKKKWYKKVPEVPGLVFLLAKIIGRIPVGQIYLYTSEARRSSWWALKILKNKWLGRKN